MTNQNTNYDYCKGVEKSVVDKSALVRLCGVLGVLTENNDLATAALLAATRIERLEKKIPALNVDLAEASTHAYNGEIARMKLEAELARLNDELETILLEYNDEITQFNAGLKAGQEGKLDRWNDQPDYEPDYDVWILGYEAGSFNRLTKQIEDLRDEGDQIKQANWNFAKEFERLNIVIETQKEELDKRATVHDEKITDHPA